jgi:hypothetical protein
VTTPAPPLTEAELSVIDDEARPTASLEFIEATVPIHEWRRLMNQARRALALESELAQLRQEYEELKAELDKATAFRND